MSGRSHLALLAALLAGCSGAPAAKPEAPAEPAAAPPPAAAPRYLAAGPRWVERADDGRDRAVIGGLRVILDGFAVASVIASGPEVDGGARAPAWTAPGPSRYVFWKGRRVYASDRFDGELRLLATLPADVTRSFDWLEGAALELRAGAFVIPPDGGPPVPLAGPALHAAVAADARFAVALSPLGRARFTADAGATWRDLGRDLAGASRLLVRGEAVVASFRGDRERIVTAAGAVLGPEAGPGALPASGPPRHQRPPFPPDPFPGGLSAALSSAVRDGTVVDGGLVVLGGGVAGRLDPAALRTTAVAALDPASAAADCHAVRVADAPLLVCVDQRHAAVIDLSGAPRTERTFALDPEPSMDRFVAVEGEALGFLGPCEGPPDLGPDANLGGERRHDQLQRTAVFCARAGADTWVEHRVDAEDAAELVAWIPRRGGGAVALVARQGNFLPDRERITNRGGLRVVRFGQSEPPLSFAAWAWDSPAPLRRRLHVRADDVIEGWLHAGANGGLAAVEIDASGRARSLPEPPRHGSVVISAPFALKSTEDGRLWETVDWGHTWTLVDPPPYAGADSFPRANACTPAGCSIGPWIRLGWSSPAERPAAPVELVSSPLPRDVSRLTRGAGPALLRLACTPESAPESRRVLDSGGFGFTSAPRPQDSYPVRLGSVGVALIPRGNQPGQADVEVGWFAPFDVTARLRRGTIPGSLLDPAQGQGPRRVHDLRVGWLLGAKGPEILPVDRGSFCGERALVAGGLVRPLGFCAEDGALGVEIGDRLFVLAASRHELTLHTAAVDRRPRPGKGAAPALPMPLTRLAAHPVSRLREFLLGAGARGASPVVVVVDQAGNASLAPLDPERGTLGAEETLRPLPEALLGSDPACAPRPDDARVLLPLEGQISLDRAALRGLSAAPGIGVAVLRWSSARACLDGVEIPVRDERFDENAGYYEPPGALRKIVARFDGGARAILVEAALGQEMRQKLRCVKAP